MRSRALAMLLLMCIAPAAWAQTGKRVAIGAAIGVSSYSNKDFSTKNPGASFAYRLTLKPHEGWSWAAKTGFGWTNGKVTTDIGGIRTPLGKLRTALIMGGVQRSYRRGPYQVSLGIAAGPSFNHFAVDNAARAAYLSRLGTDLDGIKVKNSLAVRPEISTWYDVNEWFGVQGLVSYLYNRPKAQTTAGGATTSSTWKTDHVSAHIGLVVGIY